MMIFFIISLHKCVEVKSACYIKILNNTNIDKNLFQTRFTYSGMFAKAQYWDRERDGGNEMSRKRHSHAKKRSSIHISPPLDHITNILRMVSFSCRVKTFSTFWLLKRSGRDERVYQSQVVIQINRHMPTWSTLFAEVSTKRSRSILWNSYTNDSPLERLIFINFILRIILWIHDFLYRLRPGPFFHKPLLSNLFSRETPIIGTRCILIYDLLQYILMIEFL